MSSAHDDTLLSRRMLSARDDKMSSLSSNGGSLHQCGAFILTNKIRVISFIAQMTFLKKYDVNFFAELLRV